MRLQFYRGKWAVTWRENGQTKRRSLHTADREVAERRFRDIRVERPGEAVADFVALYLEEKKIAARSYGSMLTAWRATKATFGPLRPDQITRETCRRYTLARQNAGVSNGTIIKDLGFVKAAVRWCKPNSGAVFEMPSTPPPRDRFLTRKEFDSLLAACDLPHIRLFAVLALSTGGRMSAILELTWDRVDFIRGRILLSKDEANRKGRSTVPMTKRARLALEEAFNARTIERVIEWSGKPVKSVKRAFASACDRASIEDVTPHIMRHTAAVWMVEAGVGMHEVAQFLGHSDPKVTYRVYARYSPDHLAKAAAALD